MAKEFIFLKREISGIKDIEETVKALEKISAAHLHRLKIISQQMANYEKDLKRMFVDLEGISFSGPLFKKSLSLPRLVVVLSSERGLCGKFLHDLFEFLESILKENDKILVVGRRGWNIAKDRKIKIDYFFPITKEIPLEEDIRGIKDFIFSHFIKRKVGKVLIIWPAFKSLAQQEPRVTTFLPIDSKELREEIGQEDKLSLLGYPIFEPSVKEIISYLVKEYITLVFYQKILETKLSELSARTVFMENAADKAESLIKTLSLEYFKIKRKTITKEITELYTHHRLKELCPIPQK